MTSIPQLDLSRAAVRVRARVEDRWGGLLDATSFIGGDAVAAFEVAFARFLETSEAVGVANGTDALVLALRALDVRPGDEVIVPAFTFIATAGAVRWVSAEPVFVDVEPRTLNVDPVAVEEAITERTVGVLGVHLYGCPFDVDRLADLCRSRGLWLVEDAAQAHGARWKGRRVGGFGRLASWSFYPSKNLGAFGDGGAVTGEPELLARVRRLANHGQTARYEHAEVGTNSRLDALQAAVLSCRLELLEGDNLRRREIAGRYRSGLGGTPGLTLLDEPAEADAVYHQFTILAEERDRLQSELKARGIGTGVHYPLPLHRQPAFATSRPLELPVAERAAREVLCLPMFAELTDDEVDAVVAAIRDVL